MCGCEKHNDKTAECTCICDEHANFEVARDLARKRYDAIVELAERLDEMDAKQAAIRKVLAEEWVRGKVLPRYVGAEADARVRAIANIMAEPTEEKKQ